MQITMTLTRRSGKIVALGRNEAMRILLETSEREMRRDVRQNFDSSFETNWFARLMRIFAALVQTASPLQR